MQNEELIREIATKAFCEALQENSQELAGTIARKMGAALGLQPAQRERTKELRDGATLIAGSRTQTETLEALLAASSALTPDCGLLVVHGVQATGWNCHGLTTQDNFKRVKLDCASGVAAKVISSCAAAATQVSEIDPVFTSKLGLESTARILLVPVLLKQRVAALLIALSQQSDDLAGLELLVQVAQLVLDLQAYRKASPQPAAEPARQAVAQHPAAEAPKPVVPSYQPVQEAATPASSAASAPTPAASTQSALSQSTTQSGAPALDEMHEKARRFAKLLVEEIKLYNHTKVTEGRARGDLYNRLREDIEKSRGAYQKRYGESVRDVDYFTQELIRILADNNPVVMGTGFPG
jgi:hypothetical protein